MNIMNKLGRFTRNAAPWLGAILITYTIAENNGKKDIGNARMRDSITTESSYDGNIAQGIGEMDQKGDFMEIGDYTFRASRVNNPVFIDNAGGDSDHEVWMDVYGPDGKILDLQPKNPFSTSKRYNMENTKVLTPKDILGSYLNHQLSPAL